MPMHKHLPLLLLWVPACSAPSQNAVPSQEPEWRRRADAAQSRYEELDRQVQRLLALLPKATAILHPTQLQRTYQDHRLLSDLVPALEKQIAAAREGEEGSRYRLLLRCGSGRDDGSYTVTLTRKGQRPRAKGARLLLLDRAICPSQVSLDVTPYQFGEGEFRMEVGFTARPQRPYQFGFELHRLDGERDEIVCAGGTTPQGPPVLSNVCDLSLKLTPPPELPVAR
ncbi:MAG: hypothetical protein RMK29_08795 [Myxococcales bacterium]|nr:hypothetical protein [Myxococcota bacterium]MDW8281794.1 hypothetical protein [Myxococcales bacterium]